MTVSLALDLSVERISLLQRLDGRWYRVAQASCDPDQIGEEMRLLHEEACRRAELGLATVPVLLVMPEAQGIFLTADVSTIENLSLDQIVKDNGLDPTLLCMDWRLEAGLLDIAAIPRETLAQAEEFVSAYDFASAGTIIAPLEASFPGTPWLGFAGPDKQQDLVHAGADVVSLRRREIFAHAPEALQKSPEKPKASPAARAAGIDPAHLVPLEDDPKAQDSGKVRRSFWLTILAARKLWSGARMPRLFGRALVWSGLLVAGLYGLSLLPERVEEQGTEAIVAQPTEETVTTEAPTDSETPQDTEAGMRIASLAPPPVSDFDRASAFTASQNMAHSPVPNEVGDFAQPGLDAELGSDALAIPWPDANDETAPATLPVPPPADQTFALDARGFVRPSVEGQQTPEGYLVFAGQPARLPSQRPAEEDRPVVLVAIDPSTLPEDDPLRTLRPPTRPPNLVELFERAKYGGRTEAQMLALRPVARPLSAQDRAPVAAPPTRLAIASGPRPPRRPTDLTARFAAAKKSSAATANQPKSSGSRQVAAASTAAVDAPAVSRSSTASPTAPSRGSVAERATQKKKLNLSEINLLGTFGASSRPRALVRMPGGKVVNVSVGDRVDGGRVQNIGKGQMMYVKGGRTVTLRMPSG